MTYYPKPCYHEVMSCEPHQTNNRNKFVGDSFGTINPRDLRFKLERTYHVIGPFNRNKKKTPSSRI